jgi:hypothetical protein
MAIGYLDVPAPALQEAYAATMKKAGTCRVLPRSRFNIDGDGKIRFSCLVCSPEEMNGEATGVGARGCENCTTHGGPDER